MAPAPPPPCPPGQPGPWVTRSPYPEALFAIAAASDGTDVYTAGGASLPNGTPSTRVARFSPLTDSWTLLAPLPVANSRATLLYAPNTGKFYLFGGQGLTTRIYDPTLDLWTTGAALPAARSSMAGGYWNSKLYLATGNNAGAPQAQLWEYDPLADTWDTGRAAMPEGRYQASGGVINGVLYVAGGYIEGPTFRNILYSYTIATNTWATLASLNGAVAEAGSAVVNNQLWVIGGEGELLNTATRRYNPATNSWTPGPYLNVGRFLNGTTAVGTTLLTVGGVIGAPATNSVETNTVNPTGCVTSTPPPGSTTPVPPTATRTVTPSPPPASRRSPGR